MGRISVERAARATRVACALLAAGGWTSVARAGATVPAAAAATPHPVAPARPLQDVAAHAVPAVRVWSDKDGIPQNSVVAQAFDEDGRLWLATQDGLAVYDGSSFRQVALPEGARSDWTTSIAALTGGAMAIGTHADGIWIVRGDAPKHAGKGDGLPSDTVLGLAYAKGTDDLWAATSMGVARRHDGRWTTVSDAPLAGTRVTAVALGPEREPAVWIGGDGGVARLAGGKWQVWRGGEAGLPRAIVRRVTVDGQGRAWASLFDSGIARLDGEAWTVIGEKDGLPCGDGLPLIEARGVGTDAPVMWAGMSCGLSAVAGDRITTMDAKGSGLPNDIVLSLLPTRPDQGPPALWVGTDGGGVARVSLDGWLALTPRSSPIDSAVYAFGWSRGNAVGGAPGNGPPLAWIGTQNGLLRWDGREWASVEIPSIASHDRYTNAILDAQGEGQRGLWIATFGGVARLEGERWSVYTKETSHLPSSIVLTLAEATGEGGRRELLAGMRRGLARFTGDDWVPVTERGAPSEAEVTSIVETEGPYHSKVLWVATSDMGLFRRDVGGWTQLTAATSPLPCDEVLQVQRVVLRDGTERLFVSTGEAGLAWMDPTSTSAAAHWSRLGPRTTPALPDALVYGTVQDAAGRIYATTNHGIARLTASPEGAADAFDVHVFRIDDGLPSNECNSGALAVDPSGRVWAGTVGGAAVLDPARGGGDRTPKKLLVEETLLFDDAFDLAKHPELAHDQSTLTFTFALASYHRESDTRFRTRLVGLEKQPSAWTPDAKVRYTGLHAGTYELDVWGRDYAGNVTGPVRVPFVVKPAPWLTWWAIGLYALAGASLVAAGVRWREAQLKDRARELEERVVVRTAELAASVRELDRKNRALQESHQRADRIFSAFADVLPGSVLDGKYRVGDKIGTGGFGAVFRAEQIALGRAVAVKVFRPTPGNDSALALDRFRREGMTACRVHHPNAIQIYDSGISSDGIPYLVMELLEGHALASEVERGALTLERAIGIAIPMCEALAAAHAAGIVHRDIKPDNVFLQGGDVVKLLDFGIAKLMVGDDEDDSAATGTMSAVGTPRYMAPERLTDATKQDARSDVYSAGVVLYEMVSGGSPWPGTSDVFALITSIVSGKITPLETLGVPEPVAALVRRALSPEPDERPTAAELARELGKARDAIGGEALGRVYGKTSVPPPRRVEAHVA